VTGADDEAGVLRLDLSGHAAVAEIPERYNPDELPPSRFAAEGARVHASIVRVPEDEGVPPEATLELGPQGAGVVIDPRSREVLALVGGYDAAPGFNRAVDAVRQPGSAFKPIVYALGIKSRRFTPATIVVDAPAVYDQWKPSNYEAWRYEGQIRLRHALAKSINLVAVRVIEEVSPQETVGFARELGITSELDPSLALSLGASDVKLIELVNVYATFAAGGRWEAPRIVARIVGPGGEAVALLAPEPARDVMTPAEAYVLTSMLTSVVSDGTAAAAQRLRRPVAGKTGTSNEARDAWFVGYSPSVVAGVWVGFDDRRSLGRRESGTRSALPAWIAIMRAASGDRPAVDFPVPSGVVTARIDPESGLLAWEGAENAVDEVFLEGTAPTESARPPDVADPDTFLMEQFGAPSPRAPEPPETE
jgi:penicillin-binding protein 1A